VVEHDVMSDGDALVVEQALLFFFQGKIVHLKAVNS